MGRRAGSPSGPVAVIDTGTNSTRLLIATNDDGRLREIERVTTITRLGEGVDAGGRLGAAARSRVRACIDDYATRTKRHHVARTLLFATSSVRDAIDGPEFIKSLAGRHSFEYRILSGDAEAGLAFTGALIDVHFPGRVLMFDIGGGSTEIVVGEKDGIFASRSLQLGCVRIRERFFTADAPTAVELEAARAFIMAQLTGVLSSEFLTGLDTIIAVAGTMTTLAALDLGLARYSREAVHGHILTAARIDALFASLAKLTTPQREALSVVEAGRADVIVAGALIASAMMAAGAFDSVTISENDILDGAAVAFSRGEL